ncbi:hypothetical protein FXO37_23645 [Capsicum annuum]|nr:hypothetical protein FXO37_23645 [Capsicum annuum]
MKLDEKGESSKIASHVSSDFEFEEEKVSGGGVSYVGFDPDLIRTRYASLMWNYGLRKEEAKAQSDDEASMRPPQKIGMTEDTEVHDL